MNALTRRLAVTACALLAAGCVTLHTPVDRYYALQPPPPSQRSSDAPIIFVEPFAAPGIFGGVDLIYAHGPELRSYYYHHWTEPPSSLFQEALIRYLRAALPRARVLAPQPGLRADFTIRGRLLALTQDVERSKAHLALEFVVLRGSNSVPPLVKDFDRRAPLSDLKVSSFVKAEAKLAAQAFGEVASALVGDREGPLIGAVTPHAR